MSNDFFYNLSKNLSKNQYQYDHLDFFQQTQLSLIQPMKVKLPEHVKKHITDIDNVEIVSTTANNSLLHCFLKALHDGYDDLEWSKKQNLFNLMQEELVNKIFVKRDCNKTLKKIKESSIKIGLELKMMNNPEALLYLTIYFGINIVLIDDREIEYYSAESEFIACKSSFILYLSDKGIYYLVSYNGNLLHTLSNSQLLTDLINVRPEKYVLPLVNALKDDPFEAKIKQLMKHKLVELQDMCLECGIVIKKNNGTRLVNCRKDELAHKLASSGNK